MALPMLHALSFQGSSLAGEAIRSKGLGAISQELPRLSANEIIRQVRTAGFHLNRKNALAVIAGFRRQIAGHEYTQGVSAGYLPRASLLPLATTRQSSKYYITVSVTGSLQVTGQPFTQFVTVGSNRLLTKGQATSIAESMVMGNPSYQFGGITESQVMTYTVINPAAQL